MKNYHWIGLLVVLLVGYFVGIQWPSYGKTAIDKVTGAV